MTSEQIDTLVEGMRAIANAVVRDHEEVNGEYQVYPQVEEMVKQDIYNAFHQYKD